MRKHIDIKLFILPVLIIVSLIIISFVFSSQIKILKQQIDNIYFANYVTIDKLHNIKQDYIKVVYGKKNILKYKKSILKNWNYYIKQYKTQKEKQIIKKINKQILLSFRKKHFKNIQKSLYSITYLIKYEKNSAYEQRKKFLQKYNSMKSYLLYIQIVVILFTVVISSWILYIHNRYTKDLEILNQKYKVEANTDGLTKLYNRKYFDKIFDQFIPISKENNINSVFVMIDIDFFKQYNDTYGYDAGDIALKKVAFALDDIFKKDYEFVFRLGGEEFGIVIFNTNLNYIKFMLEQLKKHIASLKIAHKASQTGYLTLSMGVVYCDKSKYNLLPRDIYNQADKKLYHSKQNGRDQYTI